MAIRWTWRGGYGAILVVGELDMGRRVLFAAGKIIGGILAVVVLLEVSLWCLFTYKRIEWVYEGSWGGKLQELQDKNLGINAFRFNDYGSTNGTYELVLFGARDCLMKGAKASAVRRCSQYGILHENEFQINKTLNGAFLLTLTPEFAPCDEDEALQIEIVRPDPDEKKTILLEFKSMSVRHFKSI